MPEYAPAPMENPHLRALEEETMWRLKEVSTAVHRNLPAMVPHRARFLKELRAALHYEKQLYEHTRDVRLESEAERLIVGALYQFTWQPDPQWNIRPEAHWTHARRFVVTLPSRLDAVWHWSGRPPTLTVETVRLWLKENIVTICPYICPA